MQMPDMTNNDFIYFTDLEKDKDIKIAIAILVGKFSDRLSSHKSAWPFMLANQLINIGYKNVSVITTTAEDWTDYDCVILDHGMEFKGTFNIFGGANDDLYQQLNRLFCGVKMYSMHHDMPDIGELITKRLKTGTDLFKTLESRIDEAREICSNIKRVDHITKTDKLCFGDSHSFSMYTPGFMANRNDGLTLFGATKRGFGEYVYPWIKELTVYLGNIDIRHHIMRQGDPDATINTLVDNYESELLKLQNRGVNKIEVIQALPIENESRKLPKTGYYKGTPFIGSWAERTELVSKFNILIEKMCSRNDWNVYKHPDIYTNSLGELSFDVMEKPKSVHLAREFYRWDLEKNEPNSNLIANKKQINALF
jgi:hypothetical protein